MSTITDRIADPDSNVVAFELDPVADESDYCARNGVGLAPARKHGWVIRAVGTAQQDGEVLGCIEDSEDQFELMQLVGGFRWSIHDSFHEALQRLVHELPARGLNETGLALQLDQEIDEWIADIVPFPLEEEPGGTTPLR